LVRLTRPLLLAVAAMLPPGAGPTPLSGEQAQVLEVFVREDCPHCARAKDFLPQLARERAGLHIIYRPVDSDPAARDDLMRLSRQAEIWPPGVPTFHIAGRILMSSAPVRRWSN
jgi:glutaredoxin